ncbi:hypothetical protein CAEBREN_30418 [Caenorhabditis brenneri]|uniref:Uncharacterized protein n=1 Tax=Caenorhabditis brenneri TaxID=135651 RepID=G0N555_CAEBE|nr:hypothetical protein CAEBREN_30418 [Caenorhabditis brenneri]
MSSPPELLLPVLIEDLFGGIVNMLPAEILEGENQDNDDDDGI